MAWMPIFIFGPLSVYLLERIKNLNDLATDAWFNRSGHRFEKSAAGAPASAVALSWRNPPEWGAPAALWANHGVLAQGHLACSDNIQQNCHSSDDPLKKNHWHLPSLRFGFVNLFCQELHTRWLSKGWLPAALRAR